MRAQFSVSTPIHISDKHRAADHYDWFQNRSLNFYQLGRFLLRNRKEYAAKVLEVMERMMKSSALLGLDDRTRMVHVTAYAGFHVACELVDAEVDLKKFWLWLVAHAKASAADIQEGQVSDTFWLEIINGFECGVFGKTSADLRKIFHLLEDRRATSPVSEYQTKAGALESYKEWKSYLLFFGPGTILEMLRGFKRRNGGDLPFTQSDLLSQMKSRPYWHESKHPSGHRQKFGGKSNKSCWCIKIDFHPLGLNRISDAEFDQSFIEEADAGNLIAAGNWTDPRKGDLFRLIEALQRGDQDSQS